MVKQKKSTSQSKINQRTSLIQNKKKLIVTQKKVEVKNKKVEKNSKKIQKQIKKNADSITSSKSLKNQKSQKSVKIQNTTTNQSNEAKIFNQILTNDAIEMEKIQQSLDYTKQTSQVLKKPQKFQEREKARIVMPQIEQNQTYDQQFVSFYEQPLQENRTKQSYLEAKQWIQKLITCNQPSAYDEITKISGHLKQCEEYLKSKKEYEQLFSKVFQIEEDEDQTIICDRKQPDRFLRPFLDELNQKFINLPFDFYEHDEQMDLERLQWVMTNFTLIAEIKKMSFEFWQQQCELGKKFHPDMPFVEFINNRLNTELILFDKLKKNLQFLQESSQTIAKMNQEDRLNLRSQEDLLLLKDGLDSCNIFIDIDLKNVLYNILGKYNTIKNELNSLQSSKFKFKVQKYTELLTKIQQTPIQLLEEENLIVKAVEEYQKLLQKSENQMKNKKQRDIIIKQYNRQNILVQPIEEMIKKYYPEQYQSELHQQFIQVDTGISQSQPKVWKQNASYSSLENPNTQQENLQQKMEQEYNQIQHEQYDDNMGSNQIEIECDDSFLEEYMNEVNRSENKEEIARDSLTEVNLQIQKRKGLLQKVILLIESNPQFKGINNILKFNNTLLIGIPQMEIIDFTINLISEFEKLYGKGTQQTVRQLKMFIYLLEVLPQFPQLSQQIEKNKFSLKSVKQFLGKTDESLKIFENQDNYSNLLSQNETTLQNSQLTVLQELQQENQRSVYDKENLNGQFYDISNMNIKIPNFERYRQLQGAYQEPNFNFNENYNIYQVLSILNFFQLSQQIYEGFLNIQSIGKIQLNLMSQSRQGIIRQFIAFDTIDLFVKEEINLNDFLDYIFDVVEANQQQKVENITSGWIESDYAVHQQLIDKIAISHLINKRVSVVNNGPEEQLYLLQAKQLSTETKKLLHLNQKRRLDATKPSEMIFVLITQKKVIRPNEFRMKGVIKYDYVDISESRQIFKPVMNIPDNQNQQRQFFFQNEFRKYGAAPIQQERSNTQTKKIMNNLSSMINTVNQMASNHQFISEDFNIDIE